MTAIAQAGRRPSFVRVFLAFLQREAREAASYKMAFVLDIGALFLVLASLHFFSRFIGASGNPMLGRYGGGYLGFALTGFVLTDVQSTLLGSFARRVRWAQMAGTLEAMLATPTRPLHLLLAAPAGDFVSVLGRGVLYATFATLWLDLHVAESGLWPALLLLAMAMAGWTGLGLLGAALAMWLRKGDPIRWLVSGLSVLTSGVLYPTSVLPGWLQSVGKYLPLTHALEGIRRPLLAGAEFSAVAGEAQALAWFAVLLLPLGAASFLWALHRARIDGSLTHY